MLHFLWQENKESKKDEKPRIMTQFSAHRFAEVA